MTCAVVGSTSFLKTPYTTALAVWKDAKGVIQLRPAANGAIMRTSVLGTIYRHDLNKAKEEAIRYAKVTHADPRSIASAVALTSAIALLHNGATFDNAMQQAEETAIQVLWSEIEALQTHMIKEEGAKWKEIAQKFEGELRSCMHASLNELALCAPPIGYTFKCLGAAFYSAREAQRLINEGMAPQDAFRMVMETIIFEGGDADTNAAAAGALLGAYLGEDAIPDSWKNNLHPQDKRVLEEALSHVEILAQHVPHTQGTSKIDF
jgi:ADP-ribosylglycohydrolase